MPSLATAIGSSSDRPAALADLLGVIVNDGVRRPTTTIERIILAPGTPYHTVLAPPDMPGEPVMTPSVAHTLREVLAEVVEHGTAQRLAGAFTDADGKPIAIGGKTGSGDNRFKRFGRGGALVSERAVSRTAAFAFYLGDRYFGVITASVEGPEAAQYHFTSSLPLSVLRLMAPALEDRLGVSPPLARHAPAPSPAKSAPETREKPAVTGAAPAARDAKERDT